mmetsp:Transcript_39661/g.93447  ORF Transcript_39661/g.93447 Transcript_39661/m.93447 type:complete len:124 (-) Transcript_39661:77-448(-)
MRAMRSRSPFEMRPPLRFTLLTPASAASTPAAAGAAVAALAAAVVVVAAVAARRTGASEVEADGAVEEGATKLEGDCEVKARVPAAPASTKLAEAALDPFRLILLWTGMVVSLLLCDWVTSCC